MPCEVQGRQKKEPFEREEKGLVPWRLARLSALWKVGSGQLCSYILPTFHMKLAADCVYLHLPLSHLRPLNRICSSKNRQGERVPVARDFPHCSVQKPVTCCITGHVALPGLSAVPMVTHTLPPTS